jgi:hypothetical protein
MENQTILKKHAENQRRIIRRVELVEGIADPAREAKPACIIHSPAVFSKQHGALLPANDGELCARGQLQHTEVRRKEMVYRTTQKGSRGYCSATMRHSSPSPSSKHSPQRSCAVGFAQAFCPQVGQVNFTLLAFFFPLALAGMDCQ